MMEKLGAPQTHLGLKNMIKEVDEDLDNKLSFREVGEGPGRPTGPAAPPWSSTNDLWSFSRPVPADLQEGSSRRTGGGQRTLGPRPAV